MNLCCGGCRAAAPRPGAWPTPPSWTAGPWASDLIFKQGLLGLSSCHDGCLLSGRSWPAAGRKRRVQALLTVAVLWRCSQRAQHVKVGAGLLRHAQILFVEALQPFSCVVLRKNVFLCFVNVVSLPHVSLARADDACWFADLTAAHAAATFLAAALAASGRCWQFMQGPSTKQPGATPFGCLKCCTLVPSVRGWSFLFKWSRNKSRLWCFGAC